MPLVGRAVRRTSPDTGSSPVVNSWNEWDPLEEVIVGIVDGAAALPWELGLETRSDLWFGSGAEQQGVVDTAAQPTGEFARNRG